MTAARVPVTISMTGLSVEAGAAERHALAATFARSHLVRLPGFFADDVLTAIDRRGVPAAFTTRVEKGCVVERQLSDDWLLGLVAVVMNDPALFATVEALTACGTIGCFTGRVYERQGASEYYPWHSDCTQDRLVGLTVNLSRAPFGGGVLQIRDADTEQILGELHHEARGDAALFRIDPALEHHVTPVTSDSPRLVLAGWFRSRPRFADQIKAP